LPETGAGDPQVAFGADGAAYFSSLGLQRGADGKQHFGVTVFRSDDNGLAWRKSAVFGLGYGPDHDQISVDPRREHAGRIFIAAVLSDYRLSLFRSEDGGNSFTGPLKVTEGAGRAVQSLNPIIFSDGSLFVPFLMYESKPIEERSTPTEDVFFAVSSEDGNSFSLPKKINTVALNAHRPFPWSDPSVGFAADVSSARFRDRLYMTWGEAFGDDYRVRFAYSKDKGSTWSNPQMLSGSVREIDQFRPAIAVNAAGVVAIRPLWGPRREFWSRSA
jgi:hypothetical protein